MKGISNNDRQAIGLALPLLLYKKEMYCLEAKNQIK